MKKYIKTGTIGMVFLFAILLLNSCSSTSLISSWAAPDGTLQRYNKILVIGLIGPRDRDLREEIENAIVNELKTRGITAGSAYAEYGPKAFENLTEQAAIKNIRNKGYDGTLTIALLDKKKEKNYTPGSVDIVPQTYRFWGYYRTVYTRIYQPGYYTVSTNFMLEANFYNLNPDKLMYSAQTKTSAPSSAQSLASEFSSTILKDMTAKGLIKSQTQN